MVKDSSILRQSLVFFVLSGNQSAILANSGSNQVFDIRSVNLTGLQNQYLASQGTSSNSLCNCRNGKMVLRVGVLDYSKRGFAFSDQTKLNSDVYEIYAQAVFFTLANFLEFEYDLLYPSDNTIGSVNADGNWTGLIGMLIDNVIT